MRFFRNLFSPAILNLLFVLGGCREKEQAGCLQGSPEAIFSADWSFVHDYHFESDGQTSLEEFHFDEKRPFSIRQSGCSTLVQQFQFTAPDSLRRWAQLKPFAVATFTDLSERHEKLFGFTQYAAVLSGLPDSMPLGQPANPGPGLTVRALRLPLPSENRWEIKFEQQTIER